MFLDDLVEVEMVLDDQPGMFLDDQMEVFPVWFDDSLDWSWLG